MLIQLNKFDQEGDFFIFLPINHYLALFGDDFLFFAGVLSKSKISGKRASVRQFNKRMQKKVGIQYPQVDISLFFTQSVVPLYVIYGQKFFFLYLMHDVYCSYIAAASMFLFLGLF